MQETLGMEDVLDVLIQLETMGHDHYEKMTGLTEVTDLRRLFGILAAQELRHRAIHEEWKQVFTPYSDTPPSDEYLAYANALLTESVSLTEDKGDGSDFASGYRAVVQLEKDISILHSMALANELSLVIVFQLRTVADTSSL